MDASRLMPSMFHRRLVLIGTIFVVIVLGLGAQIVRLSVVEGAERRAEAESKLDRRSYLPTSRGRILDRHGRILAEDRASYDIAVSYDVIAGTWAINRAATDARRAVGSTDWNAMGPEQRDALIEAHLPQWKLRTDALWAMIERLGEIDKEEIEYRRNVIRARLQARSAVVWENQRAAWLRRFGTSDELDDAMGGFRPRPLLEHRQPHVILPQASDEVAFEFRKLANTPDMEGIVHALPSHTRIRPWLNGEGEIILDRGPESGLPRPLQSSVSLSIRLEGVADHIIGSMRSEVSAEDIERRPFINTKTGQLDLGGYRVGDPIGSRGLELSFEDRLRGQRGVIDERRNTGEQVRTEPTTGEDVRTTLDIMLQARVQAILSHDLGLTRVQPWHNNNPAMPIGRPLNSAAVVLDIETGEVLAMVSMPTMAMGQRMSEARRSIDDPWINRPVEGIYPPGSIIKPLVLSAAVVEGIHALGSSIECRGRYFDHIADAARCWIYREQFGMQTHGHLRAEEALARSCNIFFYSLADRLGMSLLSDWFRRFGMGTQLDVGLPNESAGQVPDEDAMTQMRRSGEMGFASVIMGIGQGPVTWTPLQAANAYATLARGGIVRDATLVSDEMRDSPRISRENFRLPSSVVTASLEGLRQSVAESYGTGYQIRYDNVIGLSPDRIINAPGIIVWAKTGTAQAPPLRVDTTGDGEADSFLGGLSHSWFVGVVGPAGTNKPTHAIAVLVEYGGSGGRVSGPIANQIIRALQHEGYLPNPQQPRGNNLPSPLGRGVGGEGVWGGGL